MKPLKISSGLTTSRLLLPPLTRAHTDELGALYADPDVARYVGGDRLNADIIRRQAAAFADEWITHGYGQSAVIVENTGEFVGRIGLHYWSNWDEVELGYVLARSVQGQGLAAEGSRAWIDWAAGTDRFDYLIANIHPRNAPSIALALKLGFTYERDDVTPRGTPTTIYRLDL